MAVSRSLSRTAVAVASATTLAVVAPASGALTLADHAPLDDTSAESTVFIQYYYPGYTYMSQCTGSVVDDEWIITSVHCIEDDNRFLDQSDIQGEPSPEEVAEQDALVVPVPGDQPVPGSSGSSLSYDINLPSDITFPGLPSIPGITAPKEEVPLGADDPNTRYSSPEAKRVVVHVGADKRTATKHAVTDIVQHPEGYRSMDMALLKLAVPTDAPPLPIRDESVTRATPSKFYGFSSASRNTERVRVADGITTQDYNRNRIITEFPSGARTENGDSGGPVIIDGELAGVHQGTVTRNGHSHSRAMSAVYAHDWIQSVIND